MVIIMSLSLKRKKISISLTHLLFLYENKTFYIKDLDGNVLETLELE